MTSGFRKTKLGQGLVEEIKTSQGGVCAICGIPEPLAPKGKLNLDHNHTTGEIRGLLCLQCNSLIGMAKEDTATLHEAINYLSFYEKTEESHKVPDYEVVDNVRY